MKIWKDNFNWILFLSAERDFYPLLIPAMVRVDRAETSLKLKSFPYKFAIICAR